MNHQTDEIDNRIDLERILTALPPQQRRAVRLYARGYTQAEIAVKMGVSQQAISACFVSIREKLLVFYP